MTKTKPEISAAIEAGEQAIREELRGVIEQAGASVRSVSIAAGWSPGYLAHVLQGRTPLRVEHVLAVLVVLEGMGRKVPAAGKLFASALKGAKGEA